MTAPLRSAVAAVCLLALHGAAAGAEPAAMLALADQPLRIIRGAQLFKAVSGTLVQKDDIVETGAGSAQIEFGAGSIAALGPRTRVYLTALGQDEKAPAELALLQGWVKVLCTTGRRTLVATSALQVSVGAGAAIVRSAPGKDELFADEGEQLAARFDDKGRPGAVLKVAPEQYAVADGAKPLAAGRPPRQFISEMPPAFRDRIAPGPALGKAGKLAAVKEREVDFADVDAWLGARLAVRKGFVQRFRARLKDPAFRQQLEQALGQGSEWQAVLHPAAVRPLTQF
ncbi:MAG: FecR domain-containing protein [Pseudomonadota bacterium]|nr:FecR domain-containing protein [Pseudomonadota bacterium]